MAARAARRHGEGVTTDPVHRRLRDALYLEAMLLADEARSYFDAGSARDADALDPAARVRFSCESLKVTTRVMHVVAWLLTMRAVDAGEIGMAEARLPGGRLGEEPASDPETVAAMPARAGLLIEASADLHRRVSRLDRSLDEAGDSPARAMQERLARAF